MKVYKKVKCENCARFPSAEGRCWVEGCMGDDWRLKELSPADLDKMNLAAVGVLGELKERIQDMKRALSLPWDAGYNAAVNQIEAYIRDLESAADLKAMVEVQDAVSKKAVLDLVEDYDTSLSEIIYGVTHLPSVLPGSTKEKGGGKGE